MTWVGIRVFRGEGVQVSGRKLTIHNDFSTHKVDASDIHAITLEPKAVNEADATHWVPRIEQTDGRRIWIDRFDCGPTSRPPRPELAATVDEIRALLGVTADRTSRGDSFGQRPQERVADQPQVVEPEVDEVVEPEVDAFGVPVQHRPRIGIIYLLAYACLICGIVSAGVTANLLVTRFVTRGSVAVYPLYMVCISGLVAVFGTGFFLSKTNIKRGEPGRRAAIFALVLGSIFGPILLVILFGILFPGSCPAWTCGG